jgi:phosphorylcholine metabolism protein LicD
MIVILFIMTVLFLLFDNLFVTIENYATCDMPHLVLSKEELSELKDLLLVLKKYFEDTETDYFLIGGSLLGSDRNGGLMPFDDDIDIGVCMKDHDKIKNYTNPDYYFEETGFGYKFKLKKGTIFIDIMMYEKNEGLYRIINGHWPNDYFSNGDLFPLKKMFYSGILLNVPNNHKEYLHRYYPDYEDTIKIDCGHYSSECIYDKHKLPKEFNVDYDDYKYVCYTKLF